MLAATKAAVPVLQFQLLLPCETKPLLVAECIGCIGNVLELRSSIQSKNTRKGAYIVSCS